MISDALYNEADKGTRIHVIPLNDMREHEKSDMCWCEPTTKVVGDSGGRVIVHNSMDGRELIERHGLQ